MVETTKATKMHIYGLGWEKRNSFSSYFLDCVDILVRNLLQMSSLQCWILDKMLCYIFLWQIRSQIGCCTEGLLTTVRRSRT